MRKTLISITMSLMAIGTAWAQSNTVSSDKWTYDRQDMDGATVDTWSRNATLQPSGGETMLHITMAHDKANGGNLLESSIIFCQMEPLPTNQFNLTFTNKAGQKKSVFFEISANYAKQGYYVYETMGFADCMGIIKSGTKNYTLEFTNGKTATLTLDFNISKGDTKTAGILKAMKASAQTQWEATAFKTDNGKLYHLFSKDAALKTGEKFEAQLILRVRGKSDAPGFYGSYVNLIFDHALPADEFTLKFKSAANEGAYYLDKGPNAEAAKMEQQESPFALFTKDEKNGQYVYQSKQMFLGNTLANLTSRDYTIEFAGGKKLQFTLEFSTKQNVRWTVVNYPE